jgi:hypothetical protein
VAKRDTHVWSCLLCRNTMFLGQPVVCQVFRLRSPHHPRHPHHFHPRHARPRVGAELNCSRLWSRLRANGLLDRHLIGTGF